MVRPTPARPASAQSVASSAVPNARVEPTVHEVDHQIAQDEADRDQEDHTLHERIIAREDCIHDETTDARQRKNIFSDHRSANQCAELQSQYRYHRNERIPERVSADHRASVETFSA